MLPEILKSELVKNSSVIKKNTPAIFFSKNQLVYNYIYFKEALNFKDEDIFYSTKTNYESSVIEVLNDLNSNFEIASLGELQIMQKHGIASKRILFSNPVKIPSHINCAYKYGIKTFAFDTKSELEKIQIHAPNSKVFLRLAIQNDGAEWKLEHKFGANKAEAVDLLALAKQYNLTPCGISVHLGWNNHKVENWSSALKKMEDILKKLAENGISLEFINIGGGFPAHNINQYKVLTEIAKAINPIFKRIKEKYALRIIAEPGSFMVANTAILATEIYDIIQRNSKQWIFANTGIMQGFAWILNNLKYNILHSSDLEKDTKEISNFVLTGPTLDSHDVFSNSVSLPKTTQIGDILYVFPAGAYINSSKEYNKFPFPELKII